MSAVLLAVLTLVSWNARVHRAPADVARALIEYIDRHDHPQVIVLHEAREYVAALRAGLPGYRAYAWRRGGPKSANTFVLVRRDLRVTYFSRLRMATAWVGPKGGVQPGRLFPIVDIGGRGGHRIVGVHRSTAAGNGSARAEEFAALLKLAGRRSSRRRTLVIVGDLNGSATSMAPGSPGDLAKRIGGHVVPGHGPDMAVVRDGTGTGTPGPSLGSDHPLVAYKFTRRTRTKGATR